MKKIFVIIFIILAISSTGFAKMYNFQNESKQSIPLHMKKMKDKNYIINPELEKTRIEIEEKRLEIRKELLKEEPDWDKIEKLNIEIAIQEAKNRTLTMREKFEARFNSQTSSNLSNN
ncbi:hypothetical protein [Fusobacterium necrogenes]|uniref:hypothetical protein n=1 Tax=Fusobacterium necrogenes TaxID=858 RepID=UPI000E1B9967|nr:hypothetical protein [Fusobacterium necrogenes]